MSVSTEPDPVDPSTAREFRDFAIELAELADALTLPAFRGQLDVRTKPDGTWVTQVDEAVESTIRQAIGQRFPTHAVLGEEGGRHGAAEAPTWVIDPIDGTTNFVRGNPVFATLIALQIDEVEVAGVVSAPALQARWDGVLGGPARQDGRHVEVSSVQDLGDAEVAFGGLSYFHDRGLGDLVSELSTITHRQRGYGDFWGHCLVASGSSDIAIEAAVSQWDLAAVKIVVEAAGGRFSSLSGEVTADGGDALSTNGRLHDQVLDIVARSGA